MAASNQQLQTLPYHPDFLFGVVQQLLGSVKKFKVQFTDPAQRLIRAKVRAGFVSWGEQIIIQIAPTQDGGSQISVSSSSNYALVDWGKNKENVNQIYIMLNQALQQVQQNAGQNQNA